MNIYEGLLFLHGHLADPVLAGTLAERPDGAQPATAPSGPVVHAAARPRGAAGTPHRPIPRPAPLRSLGDCG